MPIPVLLFGSTATSGCGRGRLRCSRACCSLAHMLTITWGRQRCAARVAAERRRGRRLRERRGAGSALLLHRSLTAATPCGGGSLLFCEGGPKESGIVCGVVGRIGDRSLRNERARPRRSSLVLLIRLFLFFAARS